MPETSERPMRRDAAVNRERLLSAARRLFAERGADVPLEDVAQEAGVSRTTLYRHFRTREELAATVFEDNVAAIEERARQFRDRDDGIVALLDYVLDLLERGRTAGIVHPVVGIDDVMMAFPMAAGVLSDREVPGREVSVDRMRGMLHRALFAEPGSGTVEARPVFR
jgi:AcrR family transcriptional regulator